MSEVEFKVGDLVYYPNISNKIGKIVGTSVIANDPCCLKVDIDETAIFVTKDGKFVVNAPIPVIYHATQKNYEWLSATFPNVTFEPPQKRKEPKEVIKAMLESGWKSVPVLYTERGSECIGYAKKTYLTMTAIPFDPKTGKTIIDFIDGEVVLESENEQ